MRRLAQAEGSAGTPQEALKGHRPVCFSLAEGYVSTPIYDRCKLAASARVGGPAVVEEFDSTVVVHPVYHGLVDEFGSIHLVPE
jgi:N-methylhydantoinase A